MKFGVAISTTGDAHRLPLLERAVAAWSRALAPAHVVVTVDGDAQRAEAVRSALVGSPCSVVRVGQPGSYWMRKSLFGMRDGRLGVAANKNTGLSLLMRAEVEHLFLSDDDTWPLSEEGPQLHVRLGLPHSMVCWGGHRLSSPVLRHGDHTYAAWSWPRGSVLYLHRDAVGAVGGMVEEFGPGGHEHVEFSRRIHQAGLTPVLYPTPSEYGAQRGRGALRYWHAEDAPRPREPLGDLRMRRRALTSVHREDGDWMHIDAVMAARDGNTNFVPYEAGANGRASATMLSDTRQGAGGEA